MKIERAKNAKRNIVFGILLKAYQIIVPFLMRTAMIYFMGMQYLGLNSLFTSILHVLNLAELGVGNAMVFSMYKPIVENDSVTICALMKLYKMYYRVIGGIIAIAGVALTPFIPKLISGEVPQELNVYILYLLNLSVTVLSYWLFAYKNSILQAYQRTDLTSKVTLVTNTVQYVIQFLILVFFRNYYLYIMIMLLTQIVTNVSTAVVATKMYPDYKPEGNLSKDEVKQINRRIKDLFTAKLGSVIVGSVDTIVISAFLGLTVLAVYQNYYFIMNSISGFIMVIFNAVTAGIGNSFVTESDGKNYGDLKKFTFIICWLLCTCVCCLAAMYQPFMEIWVGKEYLLPYSLVILFCVYFYVCELTMVWATVKDAAGLWHADRFRPLTSSLTNLVLNLVFVKFCGLYGILLSTILSYLFIAVPWLLHNIFKLLYKRSAKKYLMKLIKYILVCILALVMTVVLVGNSGTTAWCRLISGAVIALVISTVLQFVFYRKDDEFILSRQLILHMLKKRS